jgi:hypothetical protein
MNVAMLSRALLLIAGLSLASCASSRPPAETAATARLRDSAPEKAAAHRAAAPGLALEEEEHRWGLTAARERKRARDEQRASAAQAGSGTTTVDVAPITPKP